LKYDLEQQDLKVEKAIESTAEWYYHDEMGEMVEWNGITVS